MIIKRFKISGHSMIPTLKPDQEILVSNLPYLIFKPKVGEIIAFKDGKNPVVKRIKEVGTNKYLVEGDNKKDSKSYGWIERKNIIGKVIYTKG